ncbi:MAG: DUF4249 domain-containing protein [Gemmatimonadaceae bacterium]|nr:DUF4249 domain-containing protein [Gemmatimonadaceae bacterium]
MRLQPFLVGLLTGATLLSGVACERVVGVTIPAATPRLVVEARLERVRGAVTGQQRVRLTTTDDYFSTTAPPPATGAVVRVEDDSGRVVTFTASDSAPGTYETAFLVINPGRRYTLRITYGGEEFEATETATTGVEIDSLYFASRNGNAGPALGLRATIALRDPAGTKNFYLWDQFIDGRRVISPDSDRFTRVVASDDFRDGETIPGFQPYQGIVVPFDALVRVRQIAISEQAYRFYSTLSEQSRNDGSPFGVPAASLRGNIANRTTPANVGLGYFIVAEVTEAQRRVR